MLARRAFVALSLLAHELDESIARAPLARGPRTEAFEAAITTLSKGARDPIATPRMESEDVNFLPLSQVNGRTHGRDVQVQEREERLRRVHA
jgi:hypothetical protein